MYIHCYFVNLFLFTYLASPLDISLNPSGFDQNTVGQTQDVICTISLSSVVDPDSIELAWLNEENIVTVDSRVTTNTSSDNDTIVTTIQFDPLFEEDEGVYICYAIINESFIFESIELQDFRSKCINFINVSLCINMQ